MALNLTEQSTDLALDSLIANEAKQNEKASVEEAQQKGKILYPPFIATYNNHVSKPVLVRMVSGLCPTKRSEWTVGVGQSRCICKSWLKDQTGKAWKLILPPRAADEGNPIWAFIDYVTSKTYANTVREDGSKAREKAYIYKGRTDYGKSQSEKYTIGDVYEYVTKGGESPMNGNKYKFANGLAGKEIFVANVIDRNDYAWHQENKKFKVLIKACNPSKDPANPFKTELSAYSIYTISGRGATTDQPLTKALMKEGGGFYNPWDVDLAIKGADTSKDNFAKCDVVNVSDLKEHSYYKQIDGWGINTDKIVVGPLTEEEMSWEIVDLDRGEFGCNTYQNIWNHIGDYVTAWDHMLGTNFAERIQTKIEEEKALKKMSNADEESAANEEVSAQPEPQPQAAQPSFDTMSKVEEPSVDPADATVDDFMSSILG